jgi:hypothetical protein
MKPTGLAERAERAPHTHPDPVPPSAEQSRQPLAQPPGTAATTQGAVTGVDKKSTSTPTRGRVQPGAGFDLLRGVTRLQRPTSGLAHASVKPALGGK